MKGFLSGLNIANNNLQAMDLLDKASLLMSLSSSTNNLLSVCLDKTIQPSELIIADVNYLIAINTELAEQLITLVQQIQET